MSVTHFCSVQFESLIVMTPGALVCPPLGNSLELVVPDHPLHVGSGGLGPSDAIRFLTLGHAPPQLVVLVQDNPLAEGAELPELSGARVGGSLIK